MNEAMNNLLTRRSCRKYKPDMLPQEVLDEILKAGTYAASGHGTQNPIMIAVTDKEMRDKLSKLNAKIFGKPDIDPFYGAPVVVIVLADKKYPTYVYDGSLAMGNLMLAAHALGVASCWIHRAKEEFELPEGREILKQLGIEGDYEGLMEIVKQCQYIAVKAGCDKVYTYVKITYAPEEKILTIDEKVTKHHQN